MKKELIVIFMGILMNIHYCIQNDLFITAELIIYNLFIITIPLILYAFICIIPFEENLRTKFFRYSVFFFLFLSVLIRINLSRGIHSNVPLMFFLIIGLTINLIGYYLQKQSDSKFGRFAGITLNLAGVISIFITIYFGIQIATMFIAAVLAVIALYYCYDFLRS